MLRGPVVGRKNHYGSRSLRGIQVAALFYTLCETANLVGVDPHAYRLRTLHSAIVRPGAVSYRRYACSAAANSSRSMTEGFEPSGRFGLFSSVRI
jgi:hypothetical protein